MPTTEETEADREHAGDAAGAERDPQRIGKRIALRRRGGAYVAARRPGHTDVAGQPRHEAPGHECERPERARRAEAQCFTTARLHDLGRRQEDDDRQRHEDHRDRLELALEVGPRALLDRLRDLDHLRRALVGGEHALHQVEADPDREQRSRSRKDQPERLGAPEGELLIAAFGRKDVQHRLS
jgi:hypothetical protein